MSFTAAELKIEDYSLIGNLHTAALVGKNGSIDWLCLPRFDSDACFAALLGGAENGRWQISPTSEYNVRRQYREGTLILETEFRTRTGSVRLVDFMIPEKHGADLIRCVEGIEGVVQLRMDLKVRFGYGSIVPWIQTEDEHEVLAIAGPDMVHVYSSERLSGEDEVRCGAFDIRAGQRAFFVMNWHPSHVQRPAPLKEPEKVLEEVTRWWKEWSGRNTYSGPYGEAVMRSLITLKALTHGATGGIVAAPTTSLPEEIGGVRNWDYRYCWLRDATFTLYSLMLAGYYDEARAWREWLLRAVAGRPSDVRIMYGIAGERRLSEFEVPWLKGYEGSGPVRIGNGAYQQLQLDVFGEVMDALHLARRGGLHVEEVGWRLQLDLMEHLERVWKEPDDGIWEVRGERRHFTHSKVMAWVAFDRAIKATELFGLPGPTERWRAIREEIHREVCDRGFDTSVGAFVQYYGGTVLDASLLMIPIVGFLPATDPRMTSTIEAIQRGLTRDGFVLRYSTGSGVDGLPGSEGAFLACSFWLVDNLTLLGRHEEAQALFERLLAIRNDVGLLAEEYDPRAGRQVGNFPQAFSHIALVNSARNLAAAGGPAEDRKCTGAECSVAKGESAA